MEPTNKGGNISAMNLTRDEILDYFKIDMGGAKIVTGNMTHFFKLDM